MTLQSLCKLCWTEYDPDWCPSVCPHIDGPWVYYGGVHVPLSINLVDHADCGHPEACWDEDDDADPTRVAP